ncbi:MAG: hypothetical protein NNA30_12440, partial [Nitrospira sp.]|nr:hypothetical protein [Nitrospira sp.]
MPTTPTKTMPYQVSPALISHRERLSGWATSITVHTAVVIAASGFLTWMPLPLSQDFHLELVLSSL